jgi:hypothetical protein
VSNIIILVLTGALSLLRLRQRKTLKEKTEICHFQILVLQTEITLFQTGFPFICHGTAAVRSQNEFPLIFQVLLITFKFRAFIIMV